MPGLIDDDMLAALTAVESPKEVASGSPRSGAM